nr:hypothetical protein [Candidatus Saccharibacteria bacterium]
MRKKVFILITLVSLVFIPVCKKGEEVELTYPLTKKVDQVDDYFGTKVEDPYRWLEDDQAEEV